MAWAAAVALGVAAIAGLVAVQRRAPRVTERVAPYRSDRDDERAGDVGAAWSPPRRRGWSRSASSASGDRRLGRRLREAGLDEHTAEQFRLRQYALTGCAAGVGVLVGAVVLRSPVLMLVLGASGAAVGYTRPPARLARVAEERRVRMRLELVTIDQVLAIHVRAGAGPVQAITRVVERGNGVVVEELRAVLASIRAGRSEVEAFRHAARISIEPHAARTYRLFALASEQGADLGTALRALSDDLRDVRRDELRRQATRRRAAMLVPTIAVLAPIMLLFVIAPLPSLVLGGR